VHKNIIHSSVADKMAVLYELSTCHRILKILVNIIPIIIVQTFIFFFGKSTESSV